MRALESIDRFREEWASRTKEMKLAFLSLMVVALANLASALALSWDYGGIAGPAGILCGSHHYLVVALLLYFGFRMWDGDPLAWYASLATVCAVMAVAAVEGALATPAALVHAGVAAFGVLGLLAARKQFWRHSSKE